MKTYNSEIIPKLLRFSKRFDDLSKLTNQNWVSIGDIGENKKVFIFREGGQLLVSENGIVSKGQWEYLENDSMLIDSRNVTYLFKHGFFDENIIALKLDGTETYAFFANESKHVGELNSICDITTFLQNKYLNGNSSTGRSKKSSSSCNNMIIYRVTHEDKDYRIVWGFHKVYKIIFPDDSIYFVFKGKSSGKYFYSDVRFRKVYPIPNNLENTIKCLYNSRQN